MSGGEAFPPCTVRHSVSGFGVWGSVFGLGVEQGGKVLEEHVCFCTALGTWGQTPKP